MTDNSFWLEFDSNTYLHFVSFHYFAYDIVLFFHHAVVTWKDFSK